MIEQHFSAMMSGRKEALDSLQKYPGQVPEKSWYTDETGGATAWNGAGGACAMKK